MNLVRLLKKAEVKKRHRELEPSDHGRFSKKKKRSTCEKIGIVSILTSKWVSGKKKLFVYE